jgi:lipid-A-disaccharide synthase
MVIAGEASGDLLAAELVEQLQGVLKDRGTVAEFFGAGGPKMQAAGVELAFDMTAHAVVGLIEVLKSYAKFKQLFHNLLDLAFEKRPGLIICVDFSGFNRRFARAVRARARRASVGWSPKIVQYVSPQVWASREGRVKEMARDYDLLLVIFPFEKSWYAARGAELKVEFVGHPIVDRYREWRERIARKPVVAKTPAHILLLPGSRAGELKRHLPVMLDAARQIAAQVPSQFRMILPNNALLEYAKTFLLKTPPIELQRNGLAESLLESDLAIASTGTVTMECALFKVPTVALYKTSWSTFQIGKRIVKVKYLAMPNILAGEPLFPEFVQNDATSENITTAATSLLQDQPRRETVSRKLDDVISSIGPSGASRRAAELLANLLAT